MLSNKKKLNTNDNISEYIYLVEKINVYNNEIIYKICKSKENILNGIKNYDKEGRILIKILCDDCELIYLKLIELFKNKYIFKKNRGKYYFKGNSNLMKKDIFNMV